MCNYEEQVEELREIAAEFDAEDHVMLAMAIENAANTIEEQSVIIESYRDRMRNGQDFLSSLTSCATCLKNIAEICDILPTDGKTVRFNCAFYCGKPPKEVE